MNNYIIVLNNEVYQDNDRPFNVSDNAKLFEWFLTKYNIFYKEDLVEIYTIADFVEAFNAEYIEDCSILILCNKNQLPTKILKNHELLTI